MAAANTWRFSPTMMGQAYDIAAADGANIATVWGPRDGGPPDFLRVAHLIAAAPALLAELKALRRRFHAACVHVGNSADVANEACASADAAIAAAEPQS